MGKFPELEEELYSGKIKNDEELKARAKDLGASISVSDGKEKVWRSGDNGDILVGEVTKISQESEQRRRIYLTPGAYIMADITDKEVKITGRGGVAAIVLGNKFTQRLASEGVAKANGRVNEQVIRSILEDAGKRTASVSREYIILRTEISQANSGAAVLAALNKDCEKNGWRPCGQE